MANIGQQVEEVRSKLGLNQSDFGKLFRTSAMSVSRWERSINLPSSRELIRLGLLAKESQLNGWLFWRLAGLAPNDARVLLSQEKTRAAAGRG